MELRFDQSLGYLTRELNRAIQRELAARIAPFGVTSGQWYFLRVLWQRDGVTQRELADGLGMREPTAMAALRGMEEAGWISRRAAPDDARKRIVTLTRRGSALEARLLPVAAALLDEAMAGMDAAQRESLLAGLRQARANLP